MKKQKDFMFGVSTAAYQIEGTHQEFETIWDHHEDKILDHSNCNTACDFYHQYPTDINYIKGLNVDVYRMSISWARIEPKKDTFSKEGINFYRNIFTLLKEKGILVDVTLYHWDMPKWLYDDKVGFDNPEIINYFLNYAKKMFELFDEYVHSWTTINEPWCVSIAGYYYGSHAPFVKDLSKMAAAQYYTLLCHKTVYDYYKSKYHKEIGIVYNLWKQYSKDKNKLTKIALEYSNMFQNQLYLYPLFKGKYPKKWLTRLNELGVDTGFIDFREIKELKNKTDFLGINYYFHQTVVYDQNEPFYYRHIQTVYPKTAMDWEIYPMGLIDMIKDVRSYTNKPIIITENGAAFLDTIIDNKIEDTKRIEYIKEHLQLVLDNKDKYNIQGYYLWSLLDNFEWAYGFTKRFGLIYVDYKTLKRTPKESYYFYKDFIQNYKFNH